MPLVCCSPEFHSELKRKRVTRSIVWAARISGPSVDTRDCRDQGRSIPLRLRTSCAGTERRKLTSARAVA
jgi:hypothetical protein